MTTVSRDQSPASRDGRLTTGRQREAGRSQRLRELESKRTIPFKGEAFNRIASAMAEKDRDTLSEAAKAELFVELAAESQTSFIAG